MVDCGITDGTCELFKLQSSIVRKRQWIVSLLWPVKGNDRFDEVVTLTAVRKLLSSCCFNNLYVVNVITKAVNNNTLVTTIRHKRKRLVSLDDIFRTSTTSSRRPIGEWCDEVVVVASALISPSSSSPIPSMLLPSLFEPSSKSISDIFSMFWCVRCNMKCVSVELWEMICCLQKKKLNLIKRSTWYVLYG